ncbi:MAG: hypothetical protein LH619_00365 [Chitinophagaceae bacterium]|nr:hypothetical protein [Chitinophagaceae bacterium]
MSGELLEGLVFRDAHKKDDDFLVEPVDYRKYNFRFLLNAMIEHNIYHLGQVAYVNKML